MKALQLRIQEIEAAVLREAAYTPEERQILELREIEAQIKNLEAIRDDLKAQIRERINDGEVTRIEGVGGYELQHSKPTEVFDVQAALKDGLITKTGEHAKYWSLRDRSPSLVFKPEKQK